MKHPCREVVYTVFCPFGGLGAAALGFTQARVELPGVGLRARFELLGGIDIDAEACADFEYLTGVRQFQGDVATMDVRDLRAACPRRPNCVVITAPCKGGSPLVPAALAEGEHYQDLNQLALRFVRLMLAAWMSDLPELVLFENVPGLRKRAPAMIAEVRRLLELAGYVLDEATHDCGEIAEDCPQRRRRWLLVGRLAKKLPTYLRLPPRHTPKPVRTVLEALPLPGDPSAGPMHKLPDIDVVTWVRLALIPPGGDWQDLPREVLLPAELAEHMRAPRRDRPLYANVFRVVAANDASPSVVGAVQPGSGALCVADPRHTRDGTARFSNVYAVIDAETPAPAVNGGAGPSSGAVSVCDVRPVVRGRYTNNWRVESWGDAARCVTGQTDIQTGAPSVCDPRPAARYHDGTLGVADSGEPSHAVTGGASPYTGCFAVCDVRVTCVPHPHTYGVCALDEHAHAITGKAGVGTGPFSVEDPRATAAWHRGVLGVVDADTPSCTVKANAHASTGAYSVADARATRAEGRGVRGGGTARIIRCDERVVPGVFDARTPFIIAADGSVHRPFTTLELALLQQLPARVRGEALKLAGRSNGRWRERIGNAVPVGAARAIARTMLLTLLQNLAGIFMLSNEPIWVDGDGDGDAMEALQ